MGELGLFYRLALVVFLGGSLIPHGGQNPIEPGQLNCAIITGPHTFNFLEIVAEMRNAGALLQINGAADLAGSVSSLLRDLSRGDEMAVAARFIAESGGTALDRIMEALAPFTAALGTRGRNEDNCVRKEESRART
jgi:3-deoxy-D-manno-octulosonic-acid transferase